MTKRRELADLPANVTFSPPRILAKAYRDYCHYSVTLRAEDGAQVAQERDLLIAGKVVVVMPIDIARQELVLIRQFRLPAHLANGHGDLVEFVAGRVEPGESLAEAARRECREEIGIAPEKMAEVVTFLSTPGLTDEEVTIFLATIDASKVNEGPRATTDNEQLYVHRVTIDAAIGTLDRHTTRSSPLIIGLQWLALNRSRIDDVVRARGVSQ